MKIEIKFTDEECRRLQWLLRERYNTKIALLSTLAKKAIREAGSKQAEYHIPLSER